MAYKPGESGNSAGRPPGQTPGAKLRKAILDDMPDIIATLVEQAKAGDVAASKILIDKIVPTVKSQALPVNIDPGNSLVTSGDNLIFAALTGAIAPDVAAQLIAALSSQAKLVEQQELIGRIEKLEGVSGA